MKFRHTKKCASFWSPCSSMWCMIYIMYDMLDHCQRLSMLNCWPCRHLIVKLWLLCQRANCMFYLNKRLH